MAFFEPFGQHNFCGSFVSDAAALAWIQAQRWDTLKNGTGDPEEGVHYWDSVLLTEKVWNGTAWAVLTVGVPSLAAVLATGGNSAGASTINMNANKITAVASATVAGDALAYGQSGAALSGLALMSQRLTGLAAPSAATDAATKGYVDTLVQGLAWQNEVISFLNTPPGGPLDGDRYIVDSAPTGVWVGHADDIAEWDAGAGAWIYVTARENLACYVIGLNTFYMYNGASWVVLSSLFGYTLNMAYNGAGVGAGRAITVNGGAVTMTVPDTYNTAALEVTQNDVSNNPVAMTITNAGTGVSLSLAGATRSIVSNSGDATFGVVANDANTYTLHLSAANTGAGIARIGIGADDDVDIVSTAGRLTLNGYSSAGIGVEIEATAGGGSVDIGGVNLPNQINIGTAGARSLYVGHTGATDLTLAAKVLTLSLSVNDAAAHAITISAINAGAGTATLGLSADDAVTIDSTAAGFSLDGVAASNVSVTGADLTLSTITSGTLAVTAAGLLDLNAGANLDVDVTGTFDMLSSGVFSIDGTGASNVSTTSGDLTLSTITSGNVVLSSAAALTMADAYKAASTYSGAFSLSAASAEWDTFEVNFGEVSLLNALNQLSPALTATTAAAVIPDHALVRGDGGARGVQGSGVIVDDSNNVTGVASLGTTDGRLTKGWFTDLECTNAIAGSVTGNAGTVGGYAESAFALLAGRAGGQTLYGGSAAGENLILRTTSHATKGNFLLGGALSAAGTDAVGCVVLASGVGPTAAYPADAAGLYVADRNGVANRASVHIWAENGVKHVLGDLVGIGTTAPSAALHVSRLSGIVFYLDKIGTLTANDTSSNLYISKTSDGASTYNTTGNLITIIDNPTNCPTVSGYHFTSSVGGIERIRFDPRVVNGASAVAYFFDTANALSTAGSIIASFRTNNVERFSVRGNGNFGNLIGAYGTSATNTIGIASGTAPSTSPADAVQLYSADLAGTAGLASLQVRTESGAIAAFGRNWLLGGSTTMDGSAVGVLQITNGTPPAAHVDNAIQIFSADTDGLYGTGVASLALYTEEPILSDGPYVCDRALPVTINGENFLLGLVLNEAT